MSKQLNLNQESHVNMFNLRREFIEVPENNAILITNSLVSEKIDQIATERINLDKFIARKTTDSSGTDPQKQAAETKAINTLVKKANACSIYFKNNSLTVEAAATARPKTYYSRTMDGNIIEILNNTRNILYTYKTPLTPYGVTDAWLLILDGQIETLKTLIPKPKAAIADQDAANNDIDTSIATIMELQIELDTLVINAFEEDQPNFTAAFIATGTLDTVGMHHNIVDFNVARKSDGTPINRAIIQIINPVDNLVIKTLYTNVLGNATTHSELQYFFANVTAENMAPQQITFKPKPRTTIHLNFIMAAI